MDKYAKLREKVSGENSFLVKLRTESEFDEVLYREIIETLSVWVEEWTEKKSIPKPAFLLCIDLINSLAGGNRFLSEEDSEKVEDASSEIIELLSELDA